MKTKYAKKIPKAWVNIAQVFTAMGDEQRQRILLGFEKGEEINVSTIAKVSTLSRPTVSHHLKVLKLARILKSRKLGKEVLYKLDEDYLRRSFALVLEYIDNNL